mgnify:FL=1
MVVVRRSVTSLCEAGQSTFWVRQCFGVGKGAFVTLKKGSQRFGSGTTAIGPTELMHQATVKPCTFAIVFWCAASIGIIDRVDVVQGHVCKSDVSRRVQGSKGGGNHV